MQLSVRRKPSESIQSLQKASSLWEREMCTAEFCSANYQNECPTSSSAIHENIVKYYPCYLPYPTNHITGYHFNELLWYSSGVVYPIGGMSGGLGMSKGDMSRRMGMSKGGGYPSLFYWQPSGSHYTYGRKAGSMYPIGMHSSDVPFGGGGIVAGRKTSLHNLMTDANIHYWRLLEWSIRTL